LSVAASIGAQGASRRPPPPTLVLFTQNAGDRDDFAGLQALRSKLRANGRFDVLTYDIEAPALKRAAADAHHPEWTTTPITTDEDRVALSKALGASFYAVVTHTKSSDRPDVQFVDVLAPAHIWTVTGKKMDAAADALADDAAEAVAQRAAPAPPVVAVTPPEPPVTPVIPTPSTTAPTPPVTVTAPPAVAANPAPEPAAPVVAVKPTPTVTITPPVAAAPVTPPAPVKPAAVPPVVAVTPAPAPAAKPDTPPVVVAAVPTPKPTVTPVTPEPPVVVTPPVASPTITATVAPDPVKTTPTPAAPPTPPVVVATKPAPGSGDAVEPPPIVTVTVGGVLQNTATNPGGGDVIARQMAAVKPLIGRGDAALARGEVAMAISLYRQAVDGAPRAAQPRLALAQAYLQGGFRDKALDEAKRALQVSPDSVPIKEFLIGLDDENASSEGSVTLYTALVTKNPQDVSAHIGLADAYWNDGSLDQAETEYKTAQSIEAATGGHRAVTQLARMYGAQSRYADAQEMLAQLGATRYPMSLSIIKNRADALLTGLSTAREAFDAKKSSHEQFYDTAKKVAADAQALAEFVRNVTPPAALKLSHLHRQLAINLIAQEAAVLMTYIETSDAAQGDKAASLEKSAQSEMLTAKAGEQKNGLGAEGS
jgi:tetratricopeptide (TPR) repeat protein